MGGNLHDLVKTPTTRNYDNIHLTDSAFTPINAPGHTTNLDTQLVDINEATDLWFNKSIASTLTIVSTSANDASPSGSGLRTIFIDGLDTNLDIITETIILNGLTPVITINSYKAIRTIIALSGGTIGGGCEGIITFDSVADGLNWCRMVVGDSTCETGRITIPNGYRFLLTHLFYNAGPSADITVKVSIQVELEFPFSLGELYLGSGDFSTVIGPPIFIEAGTTFKFVGFSNTSPGSKRKINASFQGQLALIEDWTRVLTT